jgi:hypothetical protein
LGIPAVLPKAVFLTEILFRDARRKGDNGS